jgi:hypothetical protein
MTRLKPGDHIGFDNAFYDQLRFIALVKNSPEFTFAPVLRRTDGDLVVAVHEGRKFGQENPLNPQGTGRALVYALIPGHVRMMEEWLRPYAPVGQSLSTTILWQDDFAGDGFPRLVEFSAR